MSSLFAQPFEVRKGQAPFVGRMISHKDEEPRTFDDGKTKQSISAVIEPLTVAVSTQDGMIKTFWPYSPKQNSTWAKIKNTMVDAYKAAFGGLPLDLDDFHGKPMLYQTLEADTAEYEEFWAKTKPEFRYKSRITVAIGPAPVGWEATVPADLADQKLTKIAEARARNVDRASGEGSISEMQPVVLDTTGSTDDSALEAKVVAHLDDILAALDGQQASTIIKAVHGNKEFRDKVGQEVVTAIFAGKVQKILQKMGVLSETGGVYTKAVAA